MNSAGDVFLTVEARLLLAAQSFQHDTDFLFRRVLPTCLTPNVLHHLVCRRFVRPGFLFHLRCLRLR